MSESPILEIEDLVVEFATEDGAVRAVDGLSLSIGAREIVGLVGESGLRQERDGARAARPRTVAARPRICGVSAF